jgi:hypothetical protein
MPRLLLIVGLVVLAADTHAEAIAGMPRATVAVRYYKHSVSHEEFRAARDLAGSILDRAGIAVLWLRCGVDGHDRGPVAPECHRAPVRHELILHVVPAFDMNATLHGQSLGFSLIDGPAARGTVATVYADRVARLARSVGADEHRLLGRAIAHEIGHLLMGHSGHSTHGLMRAVWSRQELRRNAPEDWAFSDEDATLLAARLR